MGLLATAFAAGALALSAAAASVPDFVQDFLEDGTPPGFVEDVTEDGGPPDFVEDLRSAGEQNATAAEASENAATPAEGTPEWVEDVIEDGGPPEWVEEVQEDGGPPDWVEDHRATPSAKSGR